MWVGLPQKKKLTATHWPINVPGLQHHPGSFTAHQEYQISAYFDVQLMTAPLHPNISYTVHNAVKLVIGGASFFQALEALIDAAAESLHLQMYIFDADETGTRIANALKRASLRGVKVHVMLDGYASRSLPDNFVSGLRETGIQFRWFQPLFSGDNFFVGRRMHHKVIVADARHALVTGRNVSNRYNDLPEHPAWLDCAVYVTGDVAVDLYNRCVQMYYRRAPTPPARIGSNPMVPEKCLVRMRVNDRMRNKNEISRSYVEMLRNAKEHITIMSSYFLPGRVFRKNLRLASIRGIRIRIILTKVSDVPLAKQAERFFYPWLLRRNIEIYEYRSKVLHAKVSSSDSNFVTIGSYNFNDLSAYASIELNLDIRDVEVAALAQTAFDRVIAQDCDRITAHDVTHKTRWWNTAIYRVSYELFRLFLFVFTHSLRHDDRHPNK